jgi:hypothetical protein
MTLTMDAAAPAHRGAWSTTARRVLLVAVGACLAVAVFLVASGTRAGNGHVQLHGGTAAALLLIALVLAWRSGSAGLIAAVPAIGLTAFAIPMLVEGVGALGYDPVTQARTSELATLHDVGLATTSLGMLLLVAAIAALVGMVLARRTGLPRPVIIVLAALIAIVGTLAVKVLVAGM